MSNFDFTFISDLLEYQHETGILIWKIRVNSKVPAKAKAGNVMNQGYLAVTIKGKKLLAHRVAWLLFHKNWPKGQIDHINGIKLDNRICNLRDVNASENLKNRRIPGGKNPYVGVSKIKNTNFWQANIGYNNFQKNLGRFDTPEKARLAYLSAKKIYHPNSPDH